LSNFFTRFENVAFYYILVYPTGEVRAKGY
jgi:hypothetical protein